MMKRFPLVYLSIAMLVTAAVAMAVQGTWGMDIAHHWGFISLMVLTALVSAWQAYRYDTGRFTGNRLSHTGLALLLLAVMAGVPWNENGKMIVHHAQPERIAYTEDGKPMALPFEVQLSDFQIDTYDDGQHIRQFTSTISIHGLTDEDTTTQQLQTSVNHPARYHGYRIYQDSYDVANQQFSVIKIVREPLLPLVWIAMLMMAIGALLQIRHHWLQQKKWLLLVTLGLTIIFTLLSIMRIRFGHLMPALRSGWFIPHLAFYMIAYSMLAIAIVLAVVRWLKKSETSHQISQSLLHTASSLLLLGMLCGAVWAKQAWGDYWTWDAKECWAAATWLLSLAATHSYGQNTHRKVLQIMMVILCFLAMQVTWYGVNHLPAAKNSLHTYNQK